jgi:hypothetical protein
MVKKVAIVTDTTACIPQEQAEKCSIEVVPGNLIFGDKAYRDGIDMSPSEFYTRIRKVKRLPTILQAPYPTPSLKITIKSARERLVFSVPPPRPNSAEYTTQPGWQRR